MSTSGRRDKRQILTTAPREAGARQLTKEVGGDHVSVETLSAGFPNKHIFVKEAVADQEGEEVEVRETETPGPRQVTR